MATSGTLEDEGKLCYGAWYHAPLEEGPTMQTHGQIRVAIVEDDPFQLRLFADVLRDAGRLEVVGTYENAHAAIRGIRAGTADVVVVDLQLPDLPGAEVARKLASLDPKPEVVVLTAHGERSMALEALQAGASGYLLKGNPQELPHAVRIAAGGGSVIAPAIARFLLEEVRLVDDDVEAPEPEDIRDILTKRETEVLTLLAKGLTYDDSARILGISLGTVQSHVKSIYRKLEVSSKAEAAAEAVRRGLD